MNLRHKHPKKPRKQPFSGLRRHAFNLFGSIEQKPLDSHAVPVQTRFHVPTVRLLLQPKRGPNSRRRAQWGDGHRHRIQHIMAPAAAAAALAGKGRTAVQARAALAAASAEDPRVWIALDSVVRDLRRVRDRLDGAADDAAVARQYAPLAALSGQLLRADGLRAQLGGIGAQERGQPASGFKLTINVGTAAPLTIEGDAASIPDGYQIERE
jgi:hypothetical protein